MTSEPSQSQSERTTMRQTLFFSGMLMAGSFRHYLSVERKWQKLTEAINDDALLREVVASLCTGG